MLRKELQERGNHLKMICFFDQNRDFCVVKAVYRFQMPENT